DSRLRVVVISSSGDPSPHRLPMESLFVCIGGVPRNQGLTRLGLAEDEAGYLRTGADVRAEPGSGRWPLSRSPLPLRTKQTGVVGRRRRAQRVDQTLFGGDRRGVDGGRIGPPAPRRSRWRVR